MSSCDYWNTAHYDSYFRLYDGATQVIADDDGCSRTQEGNLMSLIDHTVGEEMGCGQYCLHMGCYGSSTCRYTANITVVSADDNHGNTPVFPYTTSAMSNTNSATTYEEACVRACYGEILTFSACANSDSDTYFRLFDSITDQQIGSDDDGCAGSRLSHIQYPVSTPGCRDYCLHMGCYSLGSCGPYTVTLETTAPVIVTPTPTVMVTTSPTVSNSFPVTVGSMGSTNYAAVNSEVACTTACMGEKLIFSACDTQSTTDSYFVLTDASNGDHLAVDDDGCGSLLSIISYTVGNPGCHDVCLSMGCYENTNCGGYTVTLAREQLISSPRPSVQTTAQPSFPPTGPHINEFPHFSSNLANTNYAQRNVDIACVTACEGEVLTFSSCDSVSHTGDSYIRLFLGDTQTEVASNDDGCADRLSIIDYTAAGPGCQEYCLHMGCYSSGYCSYTTTLSIESTPTAAPTRYGGSGFPYTTSSDLSNTNSATQNYEIACASACFGDVLTFSACANTNTDTYFRLWDEFREIEVKRDDDGCSGTVLSHLEYVVMNDGCREYCLHMGCYSSGSCGPYTVDFTNSNHNYDDGSDVSSVESSADGVSTGTLAGAIVGAILGTCLLFGFGISAYLYFTDTESTVIPQSFPSESELVAIPSEHTSASATVVGSSSFGNASAHNYTQPDFSMTTTGPTPFNPGNVPLAKAVTVQPSAGGECVPMAHVAHHSVQPVPMYTGSTPATAGQSAPPSYHSSVTVQPQPQQSAPPSYHSSVTVQPQPRVPGQYSYTPVSFE